MLRNLRYFVIYLHYTVGDFCKEIPKPFRQFQYAAGEIRQPAAISIPDLINHTTRYKYLGTVLDPTLNLNDHFASVYKKASSRLRLLSKLRENLTTSASEGVYKMMIVPLFLFNCVTCLNFTDTQQQKLKSLDIRCKQYCLWPG